MERAEFIKLSSKAGGWNSYKLTQICDIPNPTFFLDFLLTVQKT